jgi:mannosyl-oligosaccharide alpha-1,2-mannosidase
MSPKGPIGYFLIDSLDSLWMAGMKEEYQRARDWVQTDLDFSKLDDKYHTFEITIRVLGGLLSAFHLSGEHDTMLLEKAVDLADRLLPAFETVSNFPRRRFAEPYLTVVPCRAEKRTTSEFR